MLQLPPQAKPNTTVYSDLKGVDFSTDPALVYNKRSPSAINMISTEGGNPQKRTGWRTVCKGDGNKVMNMWSFNYKGERQLLFQRGDGIHHFDGEFPIMNNEKEELEGQTTCLLDDSNIDSALGFATTDKSAENNFYLLKSGKIYQYYDTGLGEIEPYIPTIIISRKPGEEGGGELLDNVNLLTTRRAESFLGDDVSKEYYVTGTIDVSKPPIVKYRNSQGVYIIASASEYTVDAVEQKIVFTSPHKWIVEGEDNVYIEYDTVSMSDAAKALRTSESVAVHGSGTSNRVFLSASTDPSYDSYVWYSKANDPMYFPDQSYFLVGASDTSIMGLIKVGEYLGVVKEDNDVDNTIWLAYPTNFDDDSVYAVKQSVSGIGAISKSCFKTLNDEPLFLSKEGICGIASTEVEVERSIKNRSYYINKRLLTEDNLQDAIAITWKRYYILCINDHCYVMDGKQKTSWKTEWTNYLYECYYWENVPATAFIVHEGDLWFGTEDGRLCKFKTEETHGMRAYSDDGEAIPAEWSTPVDNDNTTAMFKTMQKKGCLCTVQPFARSSVRLYLKTDGMQETFIGEQKVNAFSWESIDFSMFSFVSNLAPKDLYFNKKKKKYKRMQIILRNDGLDEGFGVYEIVKAYTIGNYSKNKRGDGTWRV